jgi:hypothetical protein
MARKKKDEKSSSSPKKGRGDSKSSPEKDAKIPKASTPGKTIEPQKPTKAGKTGSKANPRKAPPKAKKGKTPVTKKPKKTPEKGKLLRIPKPGRKSNSGSKAGKGTKGRQAPNNCVRFTCNLPVEYHKCLLLLAKMKGSTATRLIKKFIEKKFPHLKKKSNPTTKRK